MSILTIRRFLMPLIAGGLLALAPVTIPFAAAPDALDAAIEDQEGAAPDEDPEEIVDESQQEIVDESPAEAVDASPAEIADESQEDKEVPLPTIELSPRVDLQEKRLEAVQDYMNSVRSLRARFIQQSPDGQVSRGVFHLERPGRVRFEFDGDVPILIVSDGRILNMVDYELGQVTKWPIKDTPLALMVADEIVLGQNITLVSSGPGELANMISITARDPKKPDQGTMTLVFSAEASADGGAPQMTLRAWQVVDAQGGLTTVTLAQPEVNLTLEASLWKFSDPRGDRFKRRGRRR